jgi:hyperosmotically inducible periplasmic protein
MRSMVLRCTTALTLGLLLACWTGCQRDAQGNAEIKIDNQKIKDDLHQAGQELGKDARQLGQSVKQGVRDLDQKVGPAARETLGDAALTTRVKARLIAAPDLGGIRIHVSSRDGQVTLSGTVTSEEFRQQAERIARRTGGVNEVINQLQVGPET